MEADSESVTARTFVLGLHKLCRFTSTERAPAPASNTEVMRWLEQGSVHVNNVRVGPKTVLEFPIRSFVLFPSSSRKRTTLW